MFAEIGRDERVESERGTSLLKYLNSTSGLVGWQLEKVGQTPSCRLPIPHIQENASDPTGPHSLGFNGLNFEAIVVCIWATLRRLLPTRPAAGQFKFSTQLQLVQVAETRWMWTAENSHFGIDSRRGDAQKGDFSDVRLTGT